MKNLNIEDLKNISGGYGYYPGQEKDAKAFNDVIGNSIGNFIAGFFNL